MAETRQLLVTGVGIRYSRDKGGKPVVLWAMCLANVLMCGNGKLFVIDSGSWRKRDRSVEDMAFSGWRDRTFSIVEAISMAMNNSNRKVQGMRLASIASPQLVLRMNWCSPNRNSPRRHILRTTGSQKWESIRLENVFIYLQKRHEDWNRVFGNGSLLGAAFPIDTHFRKW